MAGNSLKAVVVAVVANTLVTIAKFIGFALTGSAALLAEAVHSTADVGNQVLLWIGIRKSQQAATPEHPYGWGEARYLWNLKSAMGIFFLGCGATLFHGLHALWEFLHGHVHAEEPSWLGVGILVFALVVEGYSWWVAYVETNRQRGDQPWREFLSKGDDPTGAGVLLEDTAAMLGVLFALVGVGLSQLLHTPIFDIAATLLISLLLGWLAIFLARANGRLLIGASVEPEAEARIRAALEGDELVEEVTELKTVILGQGRVRVACKVQLFERLLSAKIQDSLTADAKRLEGGEQPLKVLTDVVGRSVRAAGREIQRLETKVREVAPRAVDVDLELT